MTLKELYDKVNYLYAMHFNPTAEIRLYIIEAREADHCFAACTKLDAYWDEEYIVLSNEQD